MEKDYDGLIICPYLKEALNKKDLKTLINLIEDQLKLSGVNEKFNYE